MERMVTYQRREEEFTQPLGHMFAHVVNHGTQFAPRLRLRSPHSAIRQATLISSFTYAPQA